MIKPKHFVPNYFSGYSNHYFSWVLFFLITALAGSKVAIAQKTSLLEKTVSIDLKGDRQDVALQKIASAASCQFSYDASLIGNETVSYSATDKTVREILNAVFKGRLQYKEKGSYIILTKAPAKLSDAKVKPELIIVSGYVIDEKTGEKIPSVTVYEKNSRTSVVTNEYGFYTIKLNKKSSGQELTIVKNNFSDTVLILTSEKNQFRNVIIKPLTPSIDSVFTDSLFINEDQITLLIADAEQTINALNVKDTLHQQFQFSVLPYLGTNMKMSGLVTNDFSFNLLGGYSMGTNYFELGGILNSSRSHVKYGQVAGVINLVGGNMTGGQLAGVTNIVKGEVLGFQLAGCVNVCDSNVNALQVAGLVNYNNGITRGVQCAGLINQNIDTVQAISMAGIGNNSMTDQTGAQFAGIFNYTPGTMRGLQLAGLYNYASKVKGVQIGLINISDTCIGVPIGFFSYVKSGYHKLEFSADEIFLANIAFRTGTRYFHNLLQAGIKPDSNSLKTWYVGYGLGTTARLNKMVNFDFDVSGSQISQGKFFTELSVLTKAYAGFEFQLAKKFSLALGATVSAYFTDNTYSKYPDLFTNFEPNVFLNENINTRYNVKMWWGGKVALRIF